MVASRQHAASKIVAESQQIPGRKGYARSLGIMTMFEHDRSPLHEAACQRVLARYAPGVVPDQVEPLGNRGGFSGAAIWRVRTTAGDFALRRWPNPGLPPARILGLHQLLQHLRREALSFVAVPLTSDQGTSLVHDSGSLWQLEPWLPGSASFRASPSTARLRAAMAALAQWHLAAARFLPRGEATTWFASHPAGASSAISERLQILNLITAERVQSLQKIISSSLSPLRDMSLQILETIRNARNSAIREMMSLQDVRVPLHSCLRDVWHDHLLFTEVRITGLIDPSACRMESVACDLSRLIGSLIGDEPAGWEAALEEYHRWRPLSHAERSLIPVYNRTGCLLSGWTWITWLYVERRSFPDLGQVEHRMQEILGRMRTLL